MPSGLSLRNPGRRDSALYSYVPFSFETHLVSDTAYRELRYKRDKLEQRLATFKLLHIGGQRLAHTVAELHTAQAAQLNYLVAHAPDPEMPVPVELTRKFNDRGELIYEDEITSAEGLTPIFSGSEPLTPEQLADVLGEDAATEVAITALGGVPASEVLP